MTRHETVVFLKPVLKFKKFLPQVSHSSESKFFSKLSADLRIVISEYHDVTICP